jgi:hypothetical protein
MHRVMVVHSSSWSFGLRCGRSLFVVVVCGASSIVVVVRRGRLWFLVRRVWFLVAVRCCPLPSGLVSHHDVAAGLPIGEG